MPPPLHEFRSRYLDTLLDFLWREWTALGVSGRDRTGVAHVIDPEALLLFTCSIGRYDPRLFDEVMDWLLLNGRYINVQRLRTILRKEGFRGGPVLAAVADWLTQRSNPAKWRLLASRSEGAEEDSEEPLRTGAKSSAHVNEPRTERKYRTREEPDAGRKYRTIASAEIGGDATPLFYLPDGRPLPVLREMDETFLRRGLLSAPVQPRGLSMPFPANGAAARLLRLRALFGVSVRCDVLNYLALNGSGHPREVARELYFAQKSVYDVLADLERAGAAVSAKATRERTYRLTPDGIRILGAEPAAAGWINWPAFFGVRRNGMVSH